MQVKVRPKGYRMRRARASGVLNIGRKAGRG